MVRLGLSDSMRSTVSLEDTEPLHTATHRHIPRRPLAASVAATTPSNEQQTAPKSATFALSTSLRVLLGAILCVALLSTGVNLLRSPWRHSTSQVEARFERLERSVALLGRHTARVKGTSDRFLKSCQEAQVAASTRTEMLHNSARRGFDEQAKLQMQEHQQVRKEVLQYHAQQRHKIQETRERLIEMNVTLPVHIAVRPVPESWQLQEEQMMLEGGDVQQAEDARGALSRRLGSAVEELSFVAEQTLQQGGSEGVHQRLSVERILIQARAESGEMETSAARQAAPFVSFVFYALVVCVSAGYLWNAVSDTRKKELLGDKWRWSPVPTLLHGLKTFLGSVVVIEDLRTSSNGDTITSSVEHIEHIEF
ncbi:Structural maintenance of chromosomes protein 4-like isoformX2 [Phytophthora cinnamomi]|uniref:Structural maintenance of chromosomes protein 4-like isoformX2 n=1 Tax=Phytophthora cinnamomi TaxID=4785 RepID=UPI00355A4388|nr:Structural maintenance of chromosomes protein 4-like isoformX2 [Phytophthora cinnamomi]